MRSKEAAPVVDLEEIGAGEPNPETIQRDLLKIAAALVVLAARSPTNGSPGDSKAIDVPDAPDVLLTVADAAVRLNVTPRWLYANHGRLPFTRRLSRKALRFSERGLERWLQQRRSGRQP